jgi:hypothetical protein
MTIRGVIGQRVIEVRYQHEQDGRMYYHEFRGPTVMYAVEVEGKRGVYLEGDGDLWLDDGRDDALA